MDYPGKVITKNQVTPTQTSATGVWTLDDAAAATRNNNWPVAGVPNPISKSLRFNSADSAYLNRTPASASNRKTWTWSGWVKKTGTSISTFISADPNSGNRATSFYTRSITDGRLEFEYFDGTTTYNLTCAALLRDPSAYYHLILAVDTTQATNTNRTKIYVNGVQQTLSGTYVPQNTDMDINNTVRHNLGRFQNANAGAGSYLDGYLTEVNFIDGQALTPSSFGMTDPVTGVWEPLKYSGTYGTNGFYLNFKDATSTTTLGYDYSGNANNWTTNNFSVTAGSGNDSLTDVPTPWIVYNTTGDVGGVVRGNYATWNPILKDAAALTATLTNGNLDAAAGATGTLAYSTIGISSGKWYFECVMTGIPSSGTVFFGICELPYNSTYLRAYRYDGGEYFNGSAWTTYGASFTTNDVIGIAFDLDNQTIEFFKNGTSQGQKTSIGLSGRTVFPLGFANTTPGAFVANFGQRPFAYTPPSGFRSLCTTNLPASTVLKGSEYMNVVLYTGNGSSQSITGVGFQPDFTWIKSRSGADNHNLFNAVVGLPNRLFSNLTNAENTTAGTLTSFNSDGFSVGSISDVNANAVTFVGWNWKANGAGVTNTAGSITSTVSANTTSGFSIVTYTGNNTASTIGHGLGVAPSMYIVKLRSTTGAWGVYHSSLGAGQVLYLNTTLAADSSAIWNSTAPTSSVFSVGAHPTSNPSGQTLVAYCFAPIAGFSAFGSYTGNGSTDGPFVYSGFRQRYVMIKRTNAEGWWYAFDTARNTYNVTNSIIELNGNLAETTGSNYAIDILSNGFKLRSTHIDVNTSGGTYIYACFAENPFKNALAR
jgi:hypothetical protein